MPAHFSIVIARFQKKKKNTKKRRSISRWIVLKLKKAPFRLSVGVFFWLKPILTMPVKIIIAYYSRHELSLVRMRNLHLSTLSHWILLINLFYNSKYEWFVSKIWVDEIKKICNTESDSINRDCELVFIVIYYVIVLMVYKSG